MAGRYWPRKRQITELWEISLPIIQWRESGRLEWNYLDVLEGLKTLHSEGISHCDLKLENTLVFRANRAEPDESSALSTEPSSATLASP